MPPRKTPPDFVLALLLIVGVFLWQRTAFPLWMLDLFHLQYAAYEFHVGDTEWVYTTDAHWNEWLAHREPVARKLGAEGDPNADYYPPLVPALLAPFADVYAYVWRDVVFALNGLLLFVFAGLILRTCRAPLAMRPFLWCLVLVLITYPMARAAKLGQSLPLLAALTWIGLLAIRDRRQTAGGVVLGVVSAIKLFPIGFIAIPFVAHRFRAVWVWTATVLLLFAGSFALLGRRIHAEWWAALKDLGAVVYPYFGNQSVTGWYSRAVLGYGTLADYFPPSASVNMLRMMGFAVFGGVTLFVLLRARRQTDDALFVPQAGLLITALLLCLPLAWDHYLLFALPALAWAIREVWMRRDNRFWEFWLAVAVFFFTMKLTRFYGDDLFGRIISGSQMFGLLMFWIWLVRRVWNSAAKPALAGGTS